MRWLVALALVLVLASSGCIRPLTRDAEPERESARAPPTLFGAAALWLNGTAHVSAIPGPVAAVVDPVEPHNCFTVRATKEDAASYLGGFLVQLEWTPASASTAEINVTVTGPPEAPASWSAQGPSPFVLSAEGGDVKPIRTPFTVELRAPAGGVPIPEQPVAFNVGIGVLESDLGSLAWDPCGTALPTP